MNSSRFWTFVAGAAVAAGVWVGPSAAVAQEKGNEHPWSVGVGAGRIDFEGDFPTKDGFYPEVNIGYNFSDWWTFQAELFVCPHLTGQHYEDFSTGKPVSVNRLDQEAGVKSTSAYGANLDALFHPTPWKRVDPYLTIGVGCIGFADRFENNSQFDGALRGGAGVIYNINDSWALQADFRGAFASVNNKGTVNSTYEVGVRYTIGAGVGPDYAVGGGPKDSDADGLTDAEEKVLGTNPFDADTDHDGLSDYLEVKKYFTDPLNPDTDYDGLKDGAEVFNHLTDPKNPDTDNGGVTDGHEVIEDHTNPLDAADDLIKFTLNIEFDWDQAVIKPQYFKDLDVIGLTMKRDPGSKARIEGHADRSKLSDKKHNDELSARRAKACLDYLADKHGIERNRMESIGYGFSRPKAPNDPVRGNPVNRRVEVYIRKSAQVKAAASMAPAATTPAEAPMTSVVEPAVK